MRGIPYGGKLLAKSLVRCRGMVLKRVKRQFWDRSGERNKESLDNYPKQRQISDWGSKKR